MSNGEKEAKKIVLLQETKEELFELFNDAFMQKYTNFDSFEGFSFSGAVFINWDAERIMGPRTSFDCCVKGNTSFDTWEEMYRTAVRVQA